MALILAVNARGRRGRGAVLIIALLVLAWPGAAPVLPAEPAAKIKNPFYERPAWRLWTEDQTPVAYANRKEIKDRTIVEREFAPPPVSDRKYPDFSQGPQGAAGLPLLKVFPRPPETAGFWDDCYATMDGAHTNIPTSWSDGRQSITLAGQFINVNYGFAFNPAGRFRLGVNFTSQSFAYRGRHIVDDFASNDDTERNFFFANCLRATPAHASYEDKRPEKVLDLYDGLFGHSYHSLGQSGSETPALLKMMLAGGCMSRSTKDSLKRNGAYAIPLLTIFKAALPYVDAEGKELPFESELRHRPAYCSSGEIPHPHYCPANPHYHSYDETAHLRRMIELARNMEVAPPVAILKLLELCVEKDGKTLRSGAAEDPRIKSANKTLVRIWGRPGETITARISLRESYDLEGRKLTYACHGVYPNQRNVAIEKDNEPGVFRIRVEHDPKLPKGRIPVVLFAGNGAGLPSNPVFVNFYWPEENELDDYPHEPDELSKEKPDELKKLNRPEVTQNLRPLLGADLPCDTAFGRPGETVRFRLDARDPEGFPVIFYRWPGEVGRLLGDQFSFTVPKDDPGRVYPIHVVCSDGTGGYTGRLFKLLVSNEPHEVPQGWLVTAIGQPEAAGTVKHAGGEFRFAGAGPAARGRDSAGTMAFQKASGDVDLVCRVDDIRVEGRPGGIAKLGLMVRDRLDDVAKYLFVSASGNAASGRPLIASCESRGGPWSNQRSRGNQQLATSPMFLRIIRRGPRLAALVSGDAVTWEQIAADNADFGQQVFAGLMLAVDGLNRGEETCRAEGRCSWISPSDQPLPIVAVKGKTRRAGVFTPPVEVEIVGAGAETRYTLDGSAPTRKSELYAGPIKLEKTGRHALRAACFDMQKAGEIVVALITIE